MAYTLKQKGTKLDSLAYKFSVVFGLLAAILMVIFAYIAHLMDYKIGSYNMIATNGILIVMTIVMVIQYKRLLSPKPVLNTRQTYVFCVAMGVIAAIAYALLFFVYIQYVRPEFLTEYQNFQDSVFLSNPKLSELEILENRRIVSQASNSGIALNAFREIALVSALISLILAIFLRSER